MFNDRLSNEAAKERINDRMREAESYSLHKRLGYGEGNGKWILVLIIVAVVVTIGLLL